MKRLSLQVGFFVLLGCLLFVAEAQYSGSSAGNPPGGAAGGDLNGTYPNPGAAKLNGVAASNYVQSASAPWQCVPASASTTSYTCTPTLFDGSAVSAAALASPANGQILVLVPDVSNTGDSFVTIDGSVSRRITCSDANNLNRLVANDLLAANPAILKYKQLVGRWSSDVTRISVGTGIQNTGSHLSPVFSLTAPELRGVTGSISGNLTLGTCDTGTASVTGATTAMVAVASPTTNPGTGVVWNAYVSAADTVTVAECGLAIVTPSATTYQVAVIQ